MHTWNALGFSIGFLALATTVGCTLSINDDEDGGGSEGGGEVGGAGEGAGSEGGGAPEPKARLFVVNLNDGVSSFEDPAALDERVEPKTVLTAGADTDMYGPRDLAVHSNGSLFIASENDGAIVIYDDALSADGVVMPSRKWKGASTMLEAPIGLALDEETDVAYVVNSASNGAVEAGIFAFGSASSADGDVAPARRITVSEGEFAPLQIVEQADRLFVATQESGNVSAVVVFDDASQLDGAVASDALRVIHDPAWAEVISIYVDAEDRLYVVSEDNVLLRYDAASTLDGPVEASATMEVTGASALSAIAFDATGTLFLADRSASFIYSFEGGAALTSGAIEPSRSFDSVNLRSPARLAIVEP